MDVEPVNVRNIQIDKLGFDTEMLLPASVKLSAPKSCHPTTGVHFGSRPPKQETKHGAAETDQLLSEGLWTVMGWNPRSRIQNQNKVQD